MIVFTSQEYPLINCFHTPFTDPSLTLESLNKVLTTVSTDNLPICLMIPVSVRRAITKLYSNEEEQRQQYLKYFINLSPYAMWTDITSELHYNEETRAEALAKAFVKSASGVWVCHV